MDSLPYLDTLLKEYLLFRGFTSTVRVFESERRGDKAAGFRVERLVDLVFEQYVPQYDAPRLLELLDFLASRFFSKLPHNGQEGAKRLRESILRYYLIYATQNGRPDKVREFFEHASDLPELNEWADWFALPYLQQPARDPRFCVFFSQEWASTLRASLANFLADVFARTALPAVLRFGEDRRRRKALEAEVDRLRDQVARMERTAREHEATLRQYERERLATPSVSGTAAAAARDSAEREARGTGTGSPAARAVGDDGNGATAHQTAVHDQVGGGHGGAVKRGGSGDRAAGEEASWRDKDMAAGVAATEGDGMVEVTRNGQTEETDVASRPRVRTQEKFAGHTAPILRCRFSADGTNVASAAADRTVRVWTPGNQVSDARNATIYCGMPMISVEWDCRTDKLLMLGNNAGSIKAWNADAKRVVGDFNVGPAFPCVVDVKCSPSEALMVAASSTGMGQNLQPAVDATGSPLLRTAEKQEGHLSVWNLKTFQRLHSLPLGTEPPPMNAIAFNHNGKIIAAGSGDGMVRLFDMGGRSPIMGWPSHPHASMCSICFGPDQNSIFSLGSDGRIVEWSLHSLRTELWSADVSHLWKTSPELAGRAAAVMPELALNLQGKSVVTTSPNIAAPLVSKGNHPIGEVSTLSGHTAAVTSVDWHPHQPICLTGSQDHSVLVTVFDA